MVGPIVTERSVGEIDRLRSCFVRIVMLSWEYPPVVVGAIAAHVEGLAEAMARNGHEVVVLSLDHPDCSPDSVVNGVRVIRASNDLPWLPDDYLAGKMASANHHLVGATRQLGEWHPDVIHAHDWSVAWAADTLHTLWDRPIVATIHSTERGRHGGHVPHGTPAAVNSVEWWLTYQAREIIACSRFMVREVLDGFDLPPDKVHLVPNGIDAAAWASAAGGKDPLVMAWGRIQYEKGFQVLARAMVDVRSAVPDVRCVIAGRGSYLPELQTQIDVEGVSEVVHLAGFVPVDQLRATVGQAAVVVVPSLYEPFGIVALEAMAAGSATIAARTGGLAEILDGTGAGLLFEPGNHDELAANIVRVLTDADLATSLRNNAAGLLRERYSWDAISTETVAVYNRATGSRDVDRR